MGATLSYLRSAPKQQPCPLHHEHTSNRLCQGCEPISLVGNGDPALPSMIDLYTRLIVLEKDFHLFRAGNSSKEAVIQYLLHSSVSNSGFKQSTVHLKEQVQVLKAALDRTRRENEEVKEKLAKAENVILALSNPMQSPSCPIPRPQPSSAMFSNSSDIPSKSNASMDDLIDLLGGGSESDNPKSMEKDTTLRSELSEDEANIEGLSTNGVPDQSVYQSFDSGFPDFFDSGFPDFPYIVHFPESDEEGKAGDDVKHMPVPWEASDTITLPRTNSVSLLELDDSSLEDSLSLVRSGSTPQSSISSGNGTASPKLTGTKCLKNASSQLAKLVPEGSDASYPESCIALKRETAQTLPGVNTYEQAQPSTPASSSLKKQPETVNASALEPRWSISEIFHSSKEREDAALLNRSIGGSSELRYPDFFKHGIRFDPSDNERDIYRTVIVSSLSPDIKLGTLLGHVRGGSVVDVKLLDTVKITGMKSALITFLHEYAAMTFEDYTKNHPVIINGVTAQVHVVSTPTWPMRIPLRKAIFDHHHTRCLRVINFPEQISPQRFRADLNTCMKMDFERVIYMHKRKDGVLELHFSSVDWAGHAFGMLSSYRAYRGCTPLFAPDPCAQPPETLGDPRTACTAKATPVVINGTALPAAGPTAVDQSGRIAKVEFENEAERRRGRGFAL